MEAEFSLHRASCSPTMSNPNRSYTLKTSSGHATPCVPSTAIVRTLWVVALTTRLCARLVSPIATFHVRRRSALPCRFRLRVISKKKKNYRCPPFTVPVPSFERAPTTWVQPSHSTSACLPSDPAAANLVLSHTLLLFSHFSRLDSSVEAVAVGTKDLAYGFNWKCAAKTIGCVAIIGGSSTVCRHSDSVRYLL